jgi:hypothetical protein
LTTAFTYSQMIRFSAHTLPKLSTSNSQQNTYLQMPPQKIILTIRILNKICITILIHCKSYWKDFQKRLSAAQCMNWSGEASSNTQTTKKTFFFWTLITNFPFLRPLQRARYQPKNICRTSNQNNSYRLSHFIWIHAQN